MSLQCVSLLYFLSERILRWSVAVFTTCRYSSRVVAFLKPVAKANVQTAKVCLNCTEPRVWLFPIGRFRFQSGVTGTCRQRLYRPYGLYNLCLSDSLCKGSMVILGRWTVRNMSEEQQTSISHQVRKWWTTSGSSDFRIWHLASIRYPHDLA